LGAKAAVTIAVDGFSDLRQDFRTFAEKIAEDNSQALIDALKEVIGDFNAKINEQFGENFKHLNEAVAKLLDWQENYRLHIETLTERFEQAAAGITAVEAATTQIATQAQAVPDAMQALGTLMQTAQHQLDDLERHLHAFSAVRDKAVNAFPIIEQNLERVTSGIKTQAEAIEQAVLSQTRAQTQITEDLRKTVEAQSHSFTTLQHGFGELEKTATKTITDMQASATTLIKTASDALIKAGERQGTALKQAADAAGQSLTSAGKEHHEAMQRAAEMYEKAIEQTLKRTGDVLSEQIQALDAQMQEELNRALNTLGRHLAGLSEKFVSDYAPLTDKLRRLVDSARSIGS
jgi:DNA anti-recombination protein RmuC